MKYTQFSFRLAKFCMHHDQELCSSYIRYIASDLPLGASYQVSLSVI